MIEAIRQEPEYTQLHAEPPPLLATVDPPFTILKRIYQPKNGGKVFFAIDMKSAIFQCYRDLGIIKNAATWEEFIAEFSPSRTFAPNKLVRVRIFGKLDKSKVHPILWKNAIWKVWQQMVAAWPELGERLMAIEGDEVVLSCPEDSITSAARRLRESCGVGTLEQEGRITFQCYRLIPFQLEGLKSSSFIRQKLDLSTGQPTGEFDLKCTQLLPTPGYDGCTRIVVLSAFLFWYKS